MTLKGMIGYKCSISSECNDTIAGALEVPARVLRRVFVGPVMPPYSSRELSTLIIR